MPSYELARFLNAHRISLYALVSVVSVSAVIVNALKNYSNFYSVAIFLSKSSRGVLVLANFGVLLALFCGRVVQGLFFGSLRPNEVERLYDRLWFFITESLLAFTIFRDEFDTPFALMFGFLLFVKSFHWLASDRIEWMDQRPYPGPPLLFHVRMTVLFAILWITDCLMFLYAVEHTLSAGVGGMVLFASEYGILMASVMNTILKYLLSAYDLRRAGRRGGENAPPWENKSMWLFYIELATDFLKLTTYLVFFLIIITFYGLPLNIIRDVYITARSFVTRLRALHRYQTATRNMDQRYPNATEAELIAMTDRTCIICREEMVLYATQDPPGHPDGPNTTPKKLPCGHIFHFYCLRSWLERQQSCPTCRRNVLDNTNTGPAPANAPAPPLVPPGNPQLGDNMAPGNVQAGNNPLGLLGRFFGAPGRIAQVRPQQMANLPAGQGQPGGIFINYQVQYQFPRNQGGNVQEPQQLQQPQAVPPFSGFPGPGGAWRPWPGQAAVNNAQEAEYPEPSAGLTEQGNETERPDVTTLDPINTVDDVPQMGPDSSPVPTPREAAALAALNRLNDKPSAGKTRDQPASSLDVENPESSTSASQSIQRLAGGSINAPQLIPLWQFLPQGGRPVPQNQGYNSIFRAPVAHNRAQAARSPNDHSPMSTQQHHQPSTLLPQFPTSLTNEQLDVLDRLTRESIDERLRILEGVSGAVHHCIDDLMRLRSALPPQTVPSTSEPGPPSQPPVNPDIFPQTGEEQAAISSSDRGKQKMREEPVSDRDKAKSSRFPHAEDNS